MEQPLDIQPVILAAGKGTRMHTSLPKILVGFRGKPLIQYLLDSIRQVNFTRKPIIVIGDRYDLVQSYLGDQFIYAFQEGQFGTGHAVLASRPKVQAKHILVLYGDTPFIKPSSLAALVQVHEKTRANFSMLISRVPNFDEGFGSFLGFGRILRDSDAKVIEVKEFADTSMDERQIKEINPGIYLFNADWLWPYLEQVPKNIHGEYYLTDVIEIAIKHGQTVSTLDIDPMEVFGINTPEQLKQAEEILVLR